MNPRLCPLCQAGNDCALAHGAGYVASCWCAKIAIDPAVLDRAPNKLSCLCKTCATRKPDEGELDGATPSASSP